MAAPIIKLKRSSVQGKSPGVADLPLGSLALNTYDGRLYVSKSTDSGVTTSIVNVSGIQIQDEGTLVGYANTLNFVGSGVTVLSITNGVGIISATSGGGGGVSISTVAPSSPLAGDLWYNSNLGRTFIYYYDGSSSQWVDAAPFNIPKTEPTPAKSTTSLTATAGQTTFSASYKAGYVDVYLNGIRLSGDEFIANNGTSVILTQGASAGDIVDVVEYTMGKGDAGPSGPLSPVVAITTNSTYYPLFVSGIGTVSPYITTTTNYFTFNPSSGTVTAVDFNSTSDLNLKNNIQKIEDPLSKVLQINGVSFNWKNNNEKSSGVIAQEVEKVMPEIVNTNEGHKTLNYNGLIGLLIEAVKEQQEQINTLKMEIENLKK